MAIDNPDNTVQRYNDAMNSIRTMPANNNFINDFIANLDTEIQDMDTNMNMMDNNNFDEMLYVRERASYYIEDLIVQLKQNIAIFFENQCNTIQTYNYYLIRKALRQCNRVIEIYYRDVENVDEDYQWYNDNVFSPVISDTIAGYLGHNQ